MQASNYASHSFVEPLEQRIAPAAVIAANGKSATWLDVDGDQVTLKVTKGTLDATNLHFAEGPQQGFILEALDLTDAEFAGTSVTITAKRDAAAGGDNAVTIGHLNATGQNLGAVKISGDLAKISAGAEPTDEVPGKTAKSKKVVKGLASLTVKSMGLFGETTIPESENLASEVIGDSGAIKVSGSLKDVSINISGSLASLSIGGSLIGTDAAESGRIMTGGSIGAITIKGDMVGSTGQSSGSIEAGGDIKSFAIGGSIIGGKSSVPENDNSGFLYADGNISKVTVGGSIFGGTQQNSGAIAAGGGIQSLTVKGSIIGGDEGPFSGSVSSNGSMKSISIGGDVIGGGDEYSGSISVAGSVGSVKIGGSVQGGSGDHSGVLELGIDSSDTVGNVSIAGHLRGGAGEHSGEVAISGRAGSLAIKGNVFGGVGNSSGAILSNGAIKAVSIGGSLVGGDLGNDAEESLDRSGSISAFSIGKLQIGGSVRSGVDFDPQDDIELTNSASIRVAETLGSVNVRGSIEGSSATPVLITARGLAVTEVDVKENVAIGGLTVGGSVRFAEILAGYSQADDLSAAAINPDAQIGKVVVNGEWEASNLIAGAAHQENHGDGNDVAAAGFDHRNIVSRIASVLIRGGVYGTAEDATDSFGIVAYRIDRVQVGSTVVAMNSGGHDDSNPLAGKYNLSSTGDVRIFEI